MLPWRVGEQMTKDFLTSLPDWYQSHSALTPGSFPSPSQLLLGQVWSFLPWHIRHSSHCTDLWLWSSTPCTDGQLRVWEEQHISNPIMIQKKILNLQAMSWLIRPKSKLFGKLLIFSSLLDLNSVQCKCHLFQPNNRYRIITHKD